MSKCKFCGYEGDENKCPFNPVFVHCYSCYYAKVCLNFKNLTGHRAEHQLIVENLKNNHDQVLNNFKLECDYNSYTYSLIDGRDQCMACKQLLGSDLNDMHRIYHVQRCSMHPELSTCVDCKYLSFDEVHYCENVNNPLHSTSDIFLNLAKCDYFELPDHMKKFYNQIGMDGTVAWNKK